LYLGSDYAEETESDPEIELYNAAILKRSVNTEPSLTGTFIVER